LTIAPTRAHHGPTIGLERGNNFANPHDRSLNLTMQFVYGRE